MVFSISRAEFYAARSRAIKVFNVLAVRYKVRPIMKPINQRKLDHINIVSEGDGIDRRKAYFDRIPLIHRALPELKLSAVDPSTTFMGKSCRSRS